MIFLIGFALVGLAILLLLMYVLFSEEEGN